ncbi:jg9041 [Pararge aegeria aegeria]|uniref:Jg9041 protein n=1 Tax=Pararge aegeria aegeria TaxID=348720 RepID=A0A8S4RDN0_9NEOP|nr:jg9041 [Pararge aegeria aegeria]
MMIFYCWVYIGVDNDLHPLEKRIEENKYGEKNKAKFSPAKRAGYAEMLEALRTAKKNKEQQNMPGNDDESDTTNDSSNSVTIKDKQEPEQKNITAKET